AFRSATISWTSNPTNPGSYSITGRDVALNSQSDSLTFTPDTTAPTTTTSCDGGACVAWANGDVSLAIAALDTGGSGVAQIRYTTDGSDPTSSGTATTHGAPRASTSAARVEWAATDNVGNTQG